MKIFRMIAQIASIFLLTSCSPGVTVHGGYQPPLIPITVSIDSNGHIQVAWEGSYHTPIGTFSVGIDANPAEMFPNANGTLTVRVNGEDTVYDLDGRQNINVNLDSGYYEKVNLQNNGKDWLLDVVRISSNGSSSSTSSGNTFQSSGSSNDSCSGTLPPHLTVGGYAYVSNDPPINNVVRDGPSLGYTQIGSIINGHSMKILDGPQCGDGYYWWKVQATRNASVLGWTPEADSSAQADNSQYWLVPCSSISSCP